MIATALSSESIRRLARLPATIVAASGLAVASAVNLGALLIWVRWLAPDAFGTLAIVGAAGLVANALAFEWLRLAGARTLVVGGEVAPTILADWLRASAISAVGLAALAVAASILGLVPPGLTVRWNGAIVLLAIGEMAIGAVALVARLQLRAWRYSAILVGRALLSVVGGIMALASGADVAGVLGAMIAASFVVAISVMTGDRLWHRAWCLHPTNLRAMLSLGAPLLPASVVQLASSLADRLIAAASLGAAAAGVLAAPADLVAKTLGFTMMALNVTAYPLLVRIFDSGDPAEAARAMRRNGRTLLIVGIPLATAFILFPSPLAALALGPDFSAAAGLLPWLASAALLRLISVFHFGVRFQLERRMVLLLPGPAVALAILLFGAHAAISMDGLLGLAKLGFGAQVGGLLVSAVLAKALLNR